MGRQERRNIQKLQKRRILWLERERKRESGLDDFAVWLEENFDDEELDKAKAYFVDLLLCSGPFKDLESELSDICKDYGIDYADAMLILDMMTEKMSDLFVEETEDAV